MATLLHIDSSINGDASVSRSVAASFRETWEAANPGGTVIHRDLSAEPLPHLEAAAYYAGSRAPEQHTEEQRAVFALRARLIKELEEADAVLIGVPLYNYSVPSAFKSWLDHVIVMGRTTAASPTTVQGKAATVVTSRGGAYGPGTPQEGHDFAVPYLQYVLGEQMGLDVDFIVPELTLAHSVPAMSELIPAADASRSQAHEAAATRAKHLASSLAA